MHQVTLSVDQLRNALLPLLLVMKYNAAAPTRRLGLTKRTNYASLHENAHDSHAAPDTTPAAAFVLAQDDESVLKPPREPDQESEATSISGASTPDNQGSNSPKITPGWLEKQEAKCFVQKSKPKRLTYSKKMANSGVLQKPRPPRNRNNGNAKFIAPAMTDISEETARKFENNEGFNRSMIPSKRTSKKADDVEFEHVKRGKVGGILEEDGFVPVPDPRKTTSTAPMLGISTLWQPLVPSQISDINDDIDELMKRRAGKGISQDNHESKKREESPEPEFMAPPKLSSSGVVEHALLRSSSLSSLSSTNSTSSNQSTKCPVCSTTISQSTMEEFKAGNHLPTNARLTTRQQGLLHKFHSKADTQNLWQERRYPDIDWTKLSERLTRHKQYISSVIDKTKPSQYVSQLQQEFIHRGRKTVILADERRAGESGARHLGYYGTRGQRVIGDWLLTNFSARLRQQSKDDHDDLKLAGSVGGYIQKVLIPEMIQQLIMEDLQGDCVMEEEAQKRAEAMMMDISVDGLPKASLPPAYILDKTEQKSANKSWLARFVAWESANCGLLLSEETEDVVPISSD